MKTHNLVSLFFMALAFPALGYAKLAWRKGIEVEVNSPLIPRELLPIRPLEHYEIPYEFLKEFISSPNNKQQNNMVKISVRYQNKEQVLKINEPLQFYRDYQLLFEYNNVTKATGLFSGEATDEGIEFINSQYPNTAGSSLEYIRHLASYFPSVKEKYYESSETTVFKFTHREEELRAGFILVHFDTKSFLICTAIWGGDAGRASGTNIILIGAIPYEENIDNNNNSKTNIS